MAIFKHCVLSRFQFQFIRNSIEELNLVFFLLNIRKIELVPKTGIRKAFTIHGFHGFKLRFFLSSLPFYAIIHNHVFPVKSKRVPFIMIALRCHFGI